MTSLGLFSDAYPRAVRFDSYDEEFPESIELKICCISSMSMFSEIADVNAFMSNEKAFGICCVRDSMAWLTDEESAEPICCETVCMYELSCAPIICASWFSMPVKSTICLRSSVRIFCPCDPSRYVWKSSEKDVANPPDAA